MSRRGYVVLALDMYDHGHSHGNADNTGGFFNFWPTSLWDAAQYMYSQDYVAKDAQGNGQIAVSGHSMGGFSSEMAIYLDEQNYAAAGYRIIKAGLSMGADYSWTSYLGLDEEAAVATFGGRTIGKICGQYDEFFFAADEPPTKSGTVYHKDYVATTAGKTLLEQEAPQADTWYTGSDGGQRIIYQPREIHPWNHFSKASTKDAIEFYATAFADQSGLVQNIASTSQIWYWKEVFELVALVGFLLMLAPLALLLMKLPYDAFASVNFPELALVQGDRLVRYVPSPWPTGPVEFGRAMNPRVFLLKLIPGMDPGMIPEIFRLYDCVIVESFGVGGIPQRLMDAFAEGLGHYEQTHKVLILTTQVTYEGSDVGVYEVGKRVKNRFRFLEAHDMTIEAVVTKSMWLLAQNCDSFDQLQQRFYRQVNFDTFYH